MSKVLLTFKSISNFQCPFQALSTPDVPDAVPYVAGTVRGRKWVPPPKPEPQNPLMDETIELDIDLGEEYEEALASAPTSEIVDLVSIL
jgi:tropomodulin